MSNWIRREHADQSNKPVGLNDNVVKIHSYSVRKDIAEGTVTSALKVSLMQVIRLSWSQIAESILILLYMFLRIISSFGALKNIILPEPSHNLPDVLDEVICNLDCWILSLQNLFDRAVYFKLTGLKFLGVIMPHEINLERYMF